MTLLVGSTLYSQWQRALPLLKQAGAAVPDTAALEALNAAASAVEAESDTDAERRHLAAATALRNSAADIINSASGPVLLGVEDSHNVRLLDILAQEFTDARFILFYSHPQAALVAAMQQGKDPVNALANWQVTAQQLLALYRRNRRKASLVEINSVLAEPKRFVEALPKDLGLVADEFDQPAAEAAAPPSILQLIATEVLAQGPDLSALLAELEASSLAIGDPAPATGHYDCSEIFSDYQELRTEVNQLTQLNAVNQDELKTVSTELQTLEDTLNTFQAHNREAQQEQALLLQQLHHVQEELQNHRLTAEAETQLILEKKEQLARRLAETETTASTALLAANSNISVLKAQLEELGATHQDSEQENELLLLQLHQVQEELETTFLQAQTVAKTAAEEREDFKKQLASIQATASQQLTAESSKAGVLKERLVALETRHQDSEQENELLLLQLHQVQEELETTFSQAQTDAKTVADERQALKKQLAAMQTEAKAAAAEREDLKKQLSAAHTIASQQLTAETSELGDLKERFVALESRHQDTEQENELLLLQLHQVQEELEHYFLQYQALTEKHVATEEFGIPVDMPVQTDKPSKPGRVSKQRLKRFFHATWYQRHAGKRTLPLSHYLRHGWKKQLSPHPLFDPQFYLESNGLQGLNYCPLIHFLDVGARLGYSPHPLFDSQWYFAEYPDVKESGVNPLQHYLDCGASEGRNPSRRFHTDWYLDTYPDVRESGMNPLLHFAMFGKADERMQGPYDR